MTRATDDNPSTPAVLGLGAIAIDRDGEVPVGVQLAWALRTRIGEGRLAPGERLPGLREMAEASGLNVNTVRAVYQRLEQDGLIDSQQGSGTFVAAAPRPPSPVSSIAASAARAAAETGVDPREVAAALYISPDSAERPAAARGAERRRALRAQITALELMLGEMEAAHPGLAPALEGARASDGPSLPSTAELERVRELLVRRLSLLQARIGADDGQDPGKSAPPQRRRRAASKRAAQPAELDASMPAKPERKQSPGPRPRARPATAGT